jgi:hypothetical protein
MCAVSQEDPLLRAQREVRDACIVACASHPEQWELLNAALMRLHAFKPSGVERLDLAYARKLLEAQERLFNACRLWKDVAAMQKTAASVVPPDIADNMRAKGRSEEEIANVIRSIEKKRDDAAGALPGQCAACGGCAPFLPPYLPASLAHSLRLPPVTSFDHSARMLSMLLDCLCAVYRQAR